MKKTLFLLLALFSHPVVAELYKCTAATGTIYQDKPCQTSQSQQIIPQAAYQPVAPQAQSSDESSAVRLESPATKAAVLSVERDAHGKIKRSEKAKDDFKKAHPCPVTGKGSGSCPGYVIDHIKALACGGADSPENMQWQTAAEGKAKDAWERDDCSRMPIVSPHETQNFPAQEDNSQTVYTGKRGGRYVLTKSGKKRYLPR